MNWKQFFSTLGAAAIAGGASAVQAAPAGTSADWKGIAISAAMTTAMTAIGLFQRPPHQNP
jgi:hypothetical protein